MLPSGGKLRAGYARSVLARRSIANPADIAYYLCFAPEDTGKQQLIRIAGARWGIETCLARVMRLQTGRSQRLTAQSGRSTLICIRQFHNPSVAVDRHEDSVSRFGSG